MRLGHASHDRCRIRLGNRLPGKKKAATEGGSRWGGTPDRLLRNIEATVGQELLDVAVAEREAQIEPDGVTNEVW
jgi:hypothetical protein